MWIDTHAHIAAEAFEADVDDVVSRATEAGVYRVVCVADTVASAHGSVALAGRHDAVYATAGIHPHNAAQATKQDFEDLAKLLETERLAAGGRVVAVGEMGLDFHYDFSPVEAQEAVFRRQIELAKAFDLPIIIHSRKAEHRILDILEAVGAPRAGGVMHCFWGDAQAAQRTLELGLYVGVGGAITFKNAGDLRAIVRELPLERLVVETDAPYLAPVPFRGKRNEPAYVAHTGRELAELLGLPEEKVAEATSRNANRLFGLDTGE